MVVADRGGWIHLGLLIRAKDSGPNPALLQVPAMAGPKAGRGGEILGDISGEAKGNPDSHISDLD